MTVNPIEILFLLWDMLVEFSKNLYNFLFNPVNILGQQVIPFFAVGGTVIIVLIIAYIVKLVTPFL